MTTWKFNSKIFHKGRKEGLILLGVCLIIIFLISNLVIRPPAVTNQPLTEQPALLTPAATGNLSCTITNFTGWTSLDTISGSQGIWLTSTNLTHLQEATEGGLRSGWWANDGGYTETKIKNEVVWKAAWTTEDVVTWLYCRFPNPNPAREYKSVRFANYIAVWSGYNAPGYISVTQYTWHMVYYDSGRTNRGFTYTVNSVPLDGVRRWCNSTVGNTGYNPRLSDLGDQWASVIQVMPWRNQLDLWDDTEYYWDYAEVMFDYTEFQALGNATSPLVTLGDADHAYKTLQKFNWNASVPDGAGLVFQYRVNTTTGWSDWLDAASDQTIDLLASQVQVRFLLYSDAVLHQKTPLITGMKIFYGDPIVLPPIISDIAQKPLATNVGYQDSVNVSCDILTYAPLIMAQVQYSYDDWGTSYAVGMTDSYGIGSGHYWGIIPATEVATTVKYKIFAENQYEYGTGTVYSPELSYTVIDNVPPNILHENSSEWVNPLHPSTFPGQVRIECQVIDEKSTVSVDLYVTQSDYYINSSFPMAYDGESGRFYYDLPILMPSGIFFYYLNATDSCQNYNLTCIFAITMDIYPPAIVTYESPKSPEYSVPVFIIANVTDSDGVSAVKMCWTIDDWRTTNISRDMEHVVDDMWRTTPPIPRQPWNTTVKWAIWANDSVGNVVIKHSQYLTTDRTAPDITQMSYILPVIEGYPFIVNFTINEPATASGIKPDSSFLVYYLKSEDYLFPYYVEIVCVSGDHWSCTISPLPLNETVRWYIKLQDNAGNWFQTSLRQYVVVEEAGLVNWINFVIWIFLMVGVTGALLVYRRHVTRRGVGLIGNRFVGLGLSLVIGTTALTWVIPMLSWWDLQNLPFQEWLLRLGQSSFSNLLIVLFFVVFFVIAASFGVFYTADRRESERGSQQAGTTEVQSLIQTVERDLSELKEG